jgi:DNA-directed RNA polymerase subunit H (RpoH/RPB5)
MREYIQHMEDHQVTHAIIIYAQQITPSAKNLIIPPLDIETFTAKELSVNPVKHLLVPRHEKIETEEEIQQILKKYYLTSKNLLPRYDPNDIVVRYYHWPIGSVIRIYRKFGNQKDPEIYYRHVRLLP